MGSRRVLPLMAAALLLAGAGTAGGREAAPAAEDPVLEARMTRITSELRCLVCQNQTIADSHAELAEDLRREVRDQLRHGASEGEIVKYMTDRYGDFVLYRPAVRSSTVLLWFGPGVMLVAGLLALMGLLRRRARMADNAFEPDPVLDAEPAREAPSSGEGASS